jgi:hypothetical protein
MRGHYIRFRGEFINFQSKSVQKSVRLRQVIYDYIMTFPGNNFSDKLENLVIKCESQTQSK